MLLSTTDTICEKKIVRHLGMVRGNTIRARHIGRDLMAVLRNIVGGEITDYTKLMGEAREQALDRMVEDAQRVGANAIVGVRFSTSEVMASAAEILVYGTAVLVEIDVDRHPRHRPQTIQQPAGEPRLVLGDPPQPDPLVDADRGGERA